MHDRLTSFCAQCGLRQPARPSCASCRGALADLTDANARSEALLAFRTAFVERESTSLARNAPSVRRAPLAFAAGSAVVVVSAISVPLMVVGGAVALTVAGVASVAGGYALGSAIRFAAPRFLLGKEARRGIDREVRELAERSLPITVPPAPPPTLGPERTSGRIVGTASASPFGDEPLLIARIVGDVGGRTIDDAWIAPGDIHLEREPGTTTERCPMLSFAWIEAKGTTTLMRTMLSPEARDRLDGYLLERGLEVGDETPLSLTVVRPGDSVRVRGMPSPRQVSDGYRGQVEIVDVVDAVLEWSAPPALLVVPGPFVPPEIDG